MRSTLLLLLALIPASVAAQAGVRPTVVTGVVYDSIGGTPLSGAQVQFYGARGEVANGMATATADSAGRFRLDSVPPGDYLAGFFHPAIDSLGIETKPRAVHVAGATQEVNLYSPSPAQLTSALCGGQRGADSTALLIGHVRHAESEEPVENGSVLVEWTETLIDKAVGIRHVERSGIAHTRAGGWFALCGVPAGFPVLARAAAGSDTTGYVELEAPPNGVTHLTFFVGTARRVIVADSAGLTLARLLRGPARLTGRVVTDKGEPANAQLEVLGTGLTARTNDQGRFSIDSLPTGSRTVTVRAIGFSPVEAVVQLAEGRPAVLDLRLPERAVVLAGVETRASMVYSRKDALFEAHRKRGVSGYFFRPTVIDGNQYQSLVTFVQQAPNTRADLVRGEYQITMRATNGKPGMCSPSMYVDGQRSMLDFATLNTTIAPEEILGVEIYTTTIGIPVEYMNPLNDSCGSIVIWTKPREAAVKRDMGSRPVELEPF